MEYKVISIQGPTPDSFQGKDGNMVNLNKYQVQFEGNAAWVTVSQSPKSPAPQIGQLMEGEIITNDYGSRFQKPKKPFGQGGFGGGGQAGGKKDYYSAGAAHSASIATAANIVAGFTAQAPKEGKITDRTAYVDAVFAVATKVKAQVDAKSKEEEAQQANAGDPGPQESQADFQVPAGTIELTKEEINAALPEEW